MEKDRGIKITNVDKQKQCDIHVVSSSTDIKKKTIWTDYYLNKYKWYRKWRKCTWYKHEFTKDALELSITFVGTWWALYGNINRYSKVVDKEQW
jgi:hypothetical protein